MHAAASAPNAIEFRSVTKKYDGHSAVSNLNLKIPAGSITVFVGPSGCGKTTSLRMINRMVEPDSGEIMVNGKKNTSLPAPPAAALYGLCAPAGGATAP